MIRRPPRSTLFPSPTLFRSGRVRSVDVAPMILDRIGDGLASRMRMDGVSLSGVIWQHEPYPQRIAYSQAYGTETDELVRHERRDRKSTRLNSSHDQISYAVF